MNLIASKASGRSTQGINLRSLSTGGTLSKAIKSSSEPKLENSSKQNNNQSSVNSDIAYSSNAFFNDKTSLSSAASDQSKLLGAIRSFTASSTPTQALSSEAKTPWLSKGAESSKLPGLNQSFGSEKFSENSGGSRRPAVPDLPKLPEKHTGETDPLVPNPDGIKLTESEFDVIRYTNKLRELQGKDPLIVKQNLTETADLSSDRMKARGQMVHGLTSGWNGENIAWGQQSAEEVVTAWKNSPGHYKNMMGDFTHIGVGDTKERDGSVYWTQQFS